MPRFFMGGTFPPIPPKKEFHAMSFFRLFILKYDKIRPATISNTSGGPDIRIVVSSGILSFKMSRGKISSLPSSL